MSTPKSGTSTPYTLSLTPMETLINIRTRYFRENMVKYADGNGRYQEIYNKLSGVRYPPFVWMVKIYDAWYKGRRATFSREYISHSGRESGIDEIIENFSDTVAEILDTYRERYSKACSSMLVNAVEMALNGDKNCVICIEIIEAINGFEYSLEDFMNILIQTILPNIDDITELHEAKNTARDVRETLKLNLEPAKRFMGDGDLNERSRENKGYQEGSVVRFSDQSDSTSTPSSGSRVSEGKISPLVIRNKDSYGKDIGNYITSKRRESLFNLFKKKKGSLTS